MKEPPREHLVEGTKHCHIANIWLIATNVFVACANPLCSFAVRIQGQNWRGPGCCLLLDRWFVPLKAGMQDIFNQTLTHEPSITSIPISQLGEI
jgi:hypothetical protein